MEAKDSTAPRPFRVSCHLDKVKGPKASSERAPGLRDNKKQVGGI